MQYGSADPAGSIVPSILATSVNTLAAVVFCKNDAKDRMKEGTIKKLESIIEKRMNALDGSEKLVSCDETLWAKK